MEVINEVSISKWNSIINNSRNATFFATPEWAQILRRTFGYENKTILFRFDDDQEILLPLIKIKQHYVSVPFYNYGGFISNKIISKEKIKQIYIFLNSQKHNTIICPNPFFPAAIDFNFKKEKYFTHILQLNRPWEKIEAGFEMRCMRAIKKAKHSNIHISLADSLDDYKKYYEIYLDSVKRWKSNFKFPFDLFRNLQQLHSNHINLWIAKKEKIIIGGILNFNFNKNIIYWHGCSLAKYWKYSPNNLLHMAAIKSAHEQECNYYDFGASANLEGVIKFKESFGAEKKYYDVTHIDGSISPVYKLARVLKSRVRWFMHALRAIQKVCLIRQD